MKSHQFFATCPRGLEALLAEELQQQGARAVQVTDGGASFGGDMAVCYRVNLHSRLATRVLLEVVRGNYASEDDLYQAALKFNWPEWFDVGRNFMVKVTGVKCPLKSLEFATLRIKDAVCDRFRQAVGSRPYIDTKEPDVRIHAYLAAEHFQFYLDTSGHALYQRGLRRASIEAPLRENLAAGILKLSGWQPGTSLLDPMCGSGTFLLEAAMMALHIAPGSRRHFGFEKLKNFDADKWKSLRQQAQSQAKPATFQKIYGSDQDLRAVRVSKQNLQEAGLLEAVQLSHADMVEVPPPAEAGVLVANPPYGVRIGEDEELAALYPKMGEALKRKFAGWNAYFLTNDLRMPKLMRLAPSKRTPLFNGPLECRLFEIRMVAGSNRKEKPADE
ncbi:MULTISPECIES: THUMP domain-containing class I SAM-dependent RNA methyltransferase [Methylovorus]|uniref:Putative RNA methylase n=1 Tax=Methylovorus glucosotrophus (strain SIP3-4) TaxID=582744 RepID=C6XC67_METGS|nr:MULTISPECIES: THUMP domain-containing protein [Methylovorus]ACT50142.1 putative RNA methylase [Methylovorus glucosotrophus SIP3-4]KAF0844520.1 putative N6-adenine-specific DNA methylase [Methylovorus glucosotrophus]MCB5207354.1 THUMP domain-containing protein [Methylovorus mays]